MFVFLLKLSEANTVECCSEGFKIYDTLRTALLAQNGDMIISANITYMQYLLSEFSRDNIFDTSRSRKCNSIFLRKEVRIVHFF